MDPVEPSNESQDASYTPLETADVKLATSAGKGLRTLRLDEIYSQKDHQWHLVRTAERPKKDRFKKYALVVRRSIDTRDGTVGSTTVDIKSSLLAKIVGEILKDTGYTGLYEDPPELDPQELFLILPELNLRHTNESAKEAPNVNILADISELISFVADHFTNMAEIESLQNAGMITYPLLWTLFPPGCPILYETELGDLQLSKIHDSQYMEDHWKQKYFNSKSSFVTFDGKNPGWGEVTYRIDAFEGAKEIISLPFYPSKFHTDANHLKETFVSRGRKFIETLGNPICMEYDGPFALEEVQENDEWCKKPFYTNGRIMVDPKSLLNDDPTNILLNPRVTKIVDPGKLREEDLQFCAPFVLGFSFDKKKFGSFSVQKIKPTTWDESAFEKLILAEKRKKLIHGLVKSHRLASTPPVFDDIVPGKGMGLIGLLSGPPGTGKTLTAEVVAELSHRPLYRVAAGDVGINSHHLDSYLDSKLTLIRRWGAVFLIDEAEVFLSTRAEGRLQQNALVTVFLRKLEYFEGIIILTTNRLHDIDDAFKSRIHFNIAFPHLTPGDRCAIWKNFLPNMSSDQLDRLSQFELNGREIKNSVASATLLKEPLYGPDKELDVDMIIDVIENLTQLKVA